jgi:hypothetical protein
VAALLRRRVASLLLLTLVLSGLPAAAWASGADVLADYEDNGSIDRCYTSAEYAAALASVRSDRQQYGDEVGEIRRARVQQLKRPGEPCRPPVVSTVTTTSGGDGGGTSPFVWVGLGLGVGVVAIGAGAVARRRKAG